MKKVTENNKDELPNDYKKSDFPKGFVKGKYFKGTNEKSVNETLQPLIRIAKKTTHLSGNPTRNKRKLKAK